MSEIIHDFGLDGKVAACTTDNGANYVAAFRNFAAETEPLENIPTDEVGDDVIEPVHNDVANQLLLGDQIELPAHRRCWYFYCICC
mgnify:CR=1 FL=1